MTNYNGWQFRSEESSLLRLLVIRRLVWLFSVKLGTG